MLTGCGAAYHWSREDFPIPVKMDANLPSNYVLFVEEAIGIWNSLVGVAFLIWDPEVYTPANPEAREPGVIRVTHGELGQNPETQTQRLGIANNRADPATGKIQSSVIRLDDALLYEDILWVVIHELGHALGLRHDTADPTSAMFPLIWEPAIQRITQRDIEAVRETLPDHLEDALPVFVPPPLLSRGFDPPTSPLPICAP